MAKIVRAVQKLFGSTAGTTEVSQFGSLKAGAPAYTTDAETIQSLSNYLQGWYGAVLGNNSPAIEDMNAIHFLFARQLAYIMQAGVPEWNAETTYYIGSMVNDGTGKIYTSLTDDNLNNAITDGTKWSQLGKWNVTSVSSGPYTVLHNNDVLEVTSGTSEIILNLPTAVGRTGKSYRIIKIDTGYGQVTLDPYSTETINSASTWAIFDQYDVVTIYSDGTNWKVIE